jgi:hypothetical protein
MAFGFGVIGFKMMAGARRRWNCNIGHGLDGVLRYLIHGSN